MKHVMIGLAIALAASSSAARADTGTDAAFVQKAQADLLGQYALAVLARSHDASPSVRALASRVAGNASSADRFLSSYAKSHGITLTGKPTFRADTQYGEMTGEHGRSFDQRFTQDIYADIELQQSDFQASLNDPTLQRFASREKREFNALGNKAQKLGG